MVHAAHESPGVLSHIEFQIGHVIVPQKERGRIAPFRLEHMFQVVRVLELDAGSDRIFARKQAERIAVAAHDLVRHAGARTQKRPHIRIRTVHQHGKRLGEHTHRAFQVMAAASIADQAEQRAAVPREAGKRVGESRGEQLARRHLALAAEAGYLLEAHFEHVGLPGIPALRRGQQLAHVFGILEHGIEHPVRPLECLGFPECALPGKLTEKSQVGSRIFHLAFGNEPKYGTGELAADQVQRGAIGKDMVDVRIQLETIGAFNRKRTDQGPIEAEGPDEALGIFGGSETDLRLRIEGQIGTIGADEHPRTQDGMLCQQIAEGGADGVFTHLHGNLGLEGIVVDRVHLARLIAQIHIQLRFTQRDPLLERIPVDAQILRAGSRTCPKGFGNRTRGGQLEQLVCGKHRPPLAGQRRLQLHCGKRIAAQCHETLHLAHKRNAQHAAEGILHLTHAIVAGQRARARRPFARGIASCQFLQRAPVHLPMPVARQRRQMDERRGGHVLGKLRGKPGAQQAPVDCGPARSGVEGAEHGRIRRAESQHFGFEDAVRMGQDACHLRRVHAIAADLAGVVQAPDNMDTALAFLRPVVRTQEGTPRPLVQEDGAPQAVFVEIAHHHTRTAVADLALARYNEARRTACSRTARTLGNIAAPAPPAFLPVRHQLHLGSRQMHAQHAETAPAFAHQGAVGDHGRLAAPVHVIDDRIFEAGEILVVRLARDNRDAQFGQRPQCRNQGCDAEGGCDMVFDEVPAQTPDIAQHSAFQQMDGLPREQKGNVQKRHGEGGLRERSVVRHEAFGQTHALHGLCEHAQELQLHAHDAAVVEDSLRVPRRAGCVGDVAGTFQGNARVEAGRAGLSGKRRQCQLVQHENRLAIRKHERPALFGKVVGHARESGADTQAGDARREMLHRLSQHQGHRVARAHAVFPQHGTDGVHHAGKSAIAGEATALPIHHRTAFGMLCGVPEERPQDHLRYILGYDLHCAFPLGLSFDHAFFSFVKVALEAVAVIPVDDTAVPMRLQALVRNPVTGGPRPARPHRAHAVLQVPVERTQPRICGDQPQEREQPGYRFGVVQNRIDALRQHHHRGIGRNRPAPHLGKQHPGVLP